MRKKKIYTFKDTASASSRDRTLCLGPVVRHLYISHWSRVYIPLPPSMAATSSFKHFEKRCTSLLFSYFSVSFLSLFPSSLCLTLGLSVFLPSMMLSPLSSLYLSLSSSFSMLRGNEIPHWVSDVFPFLSASVVLFKFLNEEIHRMKKSVIIITVSSGRINF